ncbi:hypothetical protein ACGFXC_10525 [Streptomyces sp. NPDC048507]|uniref:hypothetical protein n=1 Tax=Streptomyces sp. NPDC048507 TaxID=3365560 RepID=UPI00371A283A
MQDELHADERVTVRLMSVPSTGKRTARDGSQWGYPCEACCRFTAEGEAITYVRGSWYHTRCARPAIESGDPRDAWLTLGSQLEKYPSRFRAADIRAIVGNLMVLASLNRAMPAGVLVGPPVR